MLMNVSLRKKGMQGSSVLFPGRIGHRAARINDSIFVLGGTDRSGREISEVDRINCLSNKIDGVILESSISIEGFSLVCFQDSLFIWGGLHLRQHSNALLHFDGTRFLPLPQHPTPPKPRAYHAYTLIAHKYLIVFAGSDHHSFFNDWNLLNLKTRTWTALKPSLQLPFNLNSSMVWLNGRGILLLNEAFDQIGNRIHSNSFYEFHISNYNSGELSVRALQVGVGVTAFEEYIFTRMSVYDNNSILILGGYKASSGELHNLSFVLHVDEMRLERTKIKLKEKSEFQAIYHKSKLYLIGGILGKHQMENSLQIYEVPHPTHFKRNVCAVCRLYFDEEWSRASREAFPSFRIREDYDYNYHLRMDNRIIAKFSSSITNQFYALTLLIQSLKQLTSNHIQISYHKCKQSHSSILEMADQTYQFLKIASNFQTMDSHLLINELTMLRQRQHEHTYDKHAIEMCLLRLRMAIYRLGHSCLFSIKLSKQQLCVIYFSCLQLDCTYSNFNPSNNFHYYYNTRTKECSSKTNRHIIRQNIKHILTNPSDYQSLTQNTMNIFLFCGDQIQIEIVSLQRNQDIQTGQSCSIPINPKEERKALPFLQLSFLPSSLQSQIFVEHNPLNFINIIELLRTDSQSNILSRINQLDKIKDKGIISTIELYEYPQEYWLHKLLIYHSNRLIMHYQSNGFNICGVIVVKEEVELDLSGNHFANIEDDIIIKDVVKDLRRLKGFKRSRNFE